MADASQLCFHHRADIEALAEAMIGDPEAESPILLISGRPGQGRRYIVARAVERLREGGVRALFATVDLDGYEPERPDPLAHARHVAAKRGVALDPSDEGWIRRSSRGPRPTLHELLAAAILAGRDRASEALRAKLTDAFAASDPWTALGESVAEDERLVLHIADSAELPSVAREWLLDLALRFPRVKTVVSAYPDDGLGKLVRGRPNLRFETMPLDPGELRVLAEEALGEPGLPAAFHSAIWTESEGVPGLAAQAVASRLADGRLRREDDGLHWAGAEADPALPPAALLERAGAGLDSDDARRLSSFVSLAALCGENVPVRELLEYLGVDEDELDDWIDRLDDSVGADSDTPLFAERFQHPSLPDRTVYGFASGAFACALRIGFSTESRARLAFELLRGLGSRFAVGSRAAARIYVEVARWAEAQEQRLELERELAWWVGPDELEATRLIVESELRAGQRSALNVWTTVNTVQFGWPPERTLMLLDLLPPEALAPQVRGAAAAIRAGLLIQAGRPADAAHAAEAGLAHSNGDPLLESALWERAARAYTDAGRAGEAAQAATRVRALHEQLIESGDPRIAPLVRGYAQALRQAGRDAEADAMEAKLPRVESGADRATADEPIGDATPGSEP